MKFVVVLRQVPDLIEPLEIADTGDQLDWDEVSFVANESDEHALEQALLLKEALGGEVAVVALNYGDVDNTLYTAVARGADRVLRLSLDSDALPAGPVAAQMLATAIRPLQPDLVFIGCWAHDELLGPLGPPLAQSLGLPFVGVIRGVELEAGSEVVRVFKEFPGAARARLSITLPAVLGIQGADQPPRYVPVNRIRVAMTQSEFEESSVTASEGPGGVALSRLYAPEKSGHAEMLDGSAEVTAARIVQILEQKGLVP